MSDAPIIERAARAFYDRCPTEFVVRDGGIIHRKTWDELTKGERFHVVAGMRCAVVALRDPSDAMVKAATDPRVANGSPASKGVADVWQAMADELAKGAHQ